MCLEIINWESIGQIDSADFIQIHLRVAVHVQQPVHLLEDVGQLRVAVAAEAGHVLECLRNRLKALEERGFVAHRAVVALIVAALVLLHGNAAVFRQQHRLA